MVFLKRFSARDLIFYLLAILVMVFTFNAVQQMNEPDDPTYNEIRLLFEQEKVKYFSVEDNVLTLTLRGEGEDTSGFTGADLENTVSYTHLTLPTTERV